MKLYLQPVRGAGALLQIEDIYGNTVFVAEGDPSGHGISVKTADGAYAASIRRFCFFDLLVYDIRTIEGRSVRLVRSVSNGLPVFAALRRDWKFRGDFVLRSFDLIDGKGVLLMTHGRAWERRPDCFAVEIVGGEGLLLLCVAIAVDSESQAGRTAFHTAR